MSYLEPELQELARSVRRQAWRRFAERDAELDRTQRFSPETWSDVRDLGLIGLSFPEEEGGGGAPVLAFIVALEQVAYTSAVAALYPGTTIQVARALLDHGQPAMREKWAKRLIAGDVVASWAFTEPQTGSDPKQLATRARRDGDGWVLDGAKAFISYSGVAEIALVFAVDESGASCAFLVETEQPGWQPEHAVEVLAYGAAEARPVRLDGVRVPAEGLVGALGDGFSVMLAGEALGKLRIAALNVGVTQRALDEATRYALQRTHRGTAIGDKFPTIRALLADMSASVLAARAALYDTARRLDEGAELAGAIAALRLVTARAATETTSAALQVCGAYGLSKEMAVERLYRQAKFYEVAQGSLELQRVIAGKAVLAGYTEDRFERWKDS
ncbi:acyl-CoA dehydrogenase family protein [Gordonia polyisoprenivorans]|uniref:acyl-CoA dehydrogenase family protein n=1 Tax=Gordonia polyisoprenivorans TaxID=84595 RepID=UPI001AD714CD|nr:acyl-CoA dehydrogenase family protein [Gordonia polyisoprenivorans]QTI70966.1 acyl-CoA dehydrogenase family protein [Gordonia polyisoprenivorans]